MKAGLESIGGSRGRARRAPPYGSRFFRFDMQNFRNVAASGVHGLPYEVHAPPTGNPGSATGEINIYLYLFITIHAMSARQELQLLLQNGVAVMNLGASSCKDKTGQRTRSTVTEGGYPSSYCRCCRTYIAVRCALLTTQLCLLLCPH